MGDSREICGLLTCATLLGTGSIGPGVVGAGPSNEQGATTQAISIGEAEVVSATAGAVAASTRYVGLRYSAPIGVVARSSRGTSC